MGEGDKLSETAGRSEHLDLQTPKSKLISKEIGSVFDWLGNRRDGFLVTLAVIYGAGYLVWAVTSWINNLGLLPALDFQYFIAGIVPVVILFAGLLIGRSLQWFLLNYWPEHVGVEASGIWLVIRKLTIICCIIALLVFGFGPVGIFWGLVALILSQTMKRNTLNDQPFNAGKALILLFLILLFVGCLYSITNLDEINETILGPNAERLRTIMTVPALLFLILIPPGYDGFFSWISRVYRWFLLWFFIPLLCLVGLLFYAENVYPVLPQELGGVRPRCAFLDIALTDFSSETNKDFLSGNQTDPSGPVVRTVQLDVLYSNNSVLIVRPYTINKEPDAPIYEFRRDAVQSIYWCD